MLFQGGKYVLFSVLMGNGFHSQSDAAGFAGFSLHLPVRNAPLHPRGCRLSQAGRRESTARRRPGGDTHTARRPSRRTPRPRPASPPGARGAPDRPQVSPHLPGKGERRLRGDGARGGEGPQCEGGEGGGGRRGACGGTGALTSPCAARRWPGAAWTFCQQPRRRRRTDPPDRPRPPSASRRWRGSWRSCCPSTAAAAAAAAGGAPTAAAAGAPRPGRQRQGPRRLREAAAAAAAAPAAAGRSCSHWAGWRWNCCPRACAAESSSSGRAGERRGCAGEREAGAGGGLSDPQAGSVAAPLPAEAGGAAFSSAARPARARRPRPPLGGSRARRAWGGRRGARGASLPPGTAPLFGAAPERASGRPAAAQWPGPTGSSPRQRLPPAQQRALLTGAAVAEEKAAGPARRCPQSRPFPGPLRPTRSQLPPAPRPQRRRTPLKPYIPQTLGKYLHRKQWGWFFFSLNPPPPNSSMKVKCGIASANCTLWRRIMGVFSRL